MVPFSVKQATNAYSETSSQHQLLNPKLVGHLACAAGSLPHKSNRIPIYQFWVIAYFCI
jgi:hypothetical protein